MTTRATDYHKTKAVARCIFLEYNGEERIGKEGREEENGLERKKELSKVTFNLVRGLLLAPEHLSASV